MKRYKSDHVVTREDLSIKCTRCGEILEIKLPVMVDVYTAAGKAFLRYHRHCKPNPSEVNI